MGYSKMMGRPLSKEAYVKVSLNISGRLYRMFLDEASDRRMTLRALMELLLEERYGK